MRGPRIYRGLVPATGLLLVLACFVWLLLQTLRADDRNTDDAAADPGFAAVAVDRSDPGVEGTALPSRIEVPADAASAASKPAAADTRTRIRVVLAGSTTPVPDAEVLTRPAAFDLLGMPPEQLEGQHFLDEVAWLRRFGSRNATDAEGQVHLPGPPGGLMFASKGGLVGACWAQWTPPREGYRIELAAARPLRVLVRAADGTPAAGCRIGLRRMSLRPGPCWDAQLRNLGHTGQDGMLVCRHLPALLHDPNGLPFVGLRVVLSSPGLDHIGRDLDPERLPDGPIELQLPPTGTIDVVVQGPGGRPPPLPTWVMLEPSEQGRLAPQGTHAERCTRVGHARFDGVPLGATWNLGCEAHWHRVTVTGAGPTQPGQVVTFTIDLAADVQFATGRALDAERRPLAHRHCCLIGGDGQRVWLPTETDAEGCFVAVIPRSTLASALDAELWLMERGRNGQLSCLQQCCPVRIPAHAAGALDLGELVLAAAPVLASGRLVPREGATSPTLRTWYWDRALNGREGGFREDPRMSLVLDADGRFRIYGRPSSERLQLTGWAAPDWSVRPRQFSIGDHDIELEFDAPPRDRAAIEVQVRVHDSVLRFPDLLIGEFLTGEEEHPIDWTTTGDALFARCDWLPPGRGTLRLRALGHRTPLVVVDNIELRAGQATAAPRRLDLDLSALRAVRLRFVDDDHDLVRPERAWLCPFIADRQPEEEIRWHHGMAVVPAVGTIDVLVLAEGYRPHRHQGPAVDTEVVLQRRLEVEVEFDHLPGLPADLEWEIHLQRKSGLSPLLMAAGLTEAPFGSEGEQRWTEGNGKVVGLYLDAPGEFEAAFAVRGDAGDPIELPTRMSVSLHRAGRVRVAAPTEALRADLARQLPRDD